MFTDSDSLSSNNADPEPGTTTRLPAQTQTNFVLDIRDNGFDFSIDQDKVAAEAALDGVYVVRTSLPKEQMDSEETVRSYKLLTQVERAIRSMKTVDIRARPIHHRHEDRVRSHFFLCMLAYYVEWHMIEAWRPLLFF